MDEDLNLILKDHANLKKTLYTTYAASPFTAFSDASLMLRY